MGGGWGADQIKSDQIRPLPPLPMQFFITYKAQPHLNGRYTIFGTLIDGFDTLDKKEKVCAAAVVSCAFSCGFFVSPLSP